MESPTANRQISSEPPQAGGAAAATLPPITAKNHAAWLIPAFLVLITVAAYLPAMSAGFIWDDESYVEQNPVLVGVGGLQQIWFNIGATPQYYPLVFTTFWIERQLWGVHPLGYHVVNILLQGATAVVLWKVLARLKVPGALLAAAIFAIHPVNAESVAWITERKNVLSGLLGLSSLLFYMRWSGLGGDGRPERNPRLYSVALGLFVAALLSKTVVCVLPAVILVLLWWQRPRLTWSDIRPVLLMLAIALGMGVITILVERYRCGAQGAEWSLSLSERAVNAGRIICFYASKLVWPTRLTFIYPRWQATTAQWVYGAGALLVLAALWLLRRPLGKGPLAAALIFVGALFPTLGFINVYLMRYSFVADHFVYLPGIAFIALCSAVLATGAQRIFGAKLSPVLAAGLLCTLGVLTWRQCHIYKDRETLWKDTLDKNPTSWLAWNNLGREYLDQGKPADAMRCYFKAREMAPRNAEVYCHIGFALMHEEAYGEAVTYLKQATELDPQNQIAFSDLGFALGRLGRYDESVASFRRAVEIAPRNPLLHFNLAEGLARKGEVEEAEKEYREAVRRNPYLPQPQFKLGVLLQSRGALDEAVQHLRRAAALAPNVPDVRLQLAAALIHQGKPAEAVKHLRAALALNPNDPRPYQKLREVGETP